MILARVTDFDVTCEANRTTEVRLDGTILQVLEKIQDETWIMLEVDTATSEGQKVLREVMYWDGPVLAAIKTQIQLTEDEKLREELTQKYGF